MRKIVRILLGGLGNACRPMMEIMRQDRDRAAREYGFEFRIVGAADSSGAAISGDGIPPELISSIKNAKGGIASVPNAGIPGVTVAEMIQRCEADIYVDAMPANLPDGEPGSANILTALGKGMHIVSANKAPFALHWREIFDLAASQKRLVRYGAAAGAGLPVLEMGRMLGSCGELLEFSGVFNTTCTYIIGERNAGKSYEEALAGARAGGFLEANPAIDVEGWDIAMKTLIQANTYWGKAYHLKDVSIRGIQSLKEQEIRDAAARGERWCMVGRAIQQPDGSLKLSAGPVSLPLEHPLARARWHDKALYMKTRHQGEQVHYGFGISASGTPGTIYHDLIMVARTL